MKKDVSSIVGIDWVVNSCNKVVPLSVGYYTETLGANLAEEPRGVVMALQWWGHKTHWEDYNIWLCQQNDEEVTTGLE